MTATLASEELHGKEGKGSGNHSPKPKQFFVEQLVAMEP